MGNEKHARDFLLFVADNDARLRKNLMKNITYDEELFDDVYSSAIIKVYNAIMKGSVIKDFEQYFFIACKFEYINTQNKHRNMRNMCDRDLLTAVFNGKDTNETKLMCNDNEWVDREERNERITDLFNFITDRLNEVFRPDQADIFLIYYKLKTESHGKKAGISYKKLASITGKSVKEITQIIQTIKAFVRKDEQIQELYKKLIKK